MVDRIVPSTTDADRETVAGLIGADDAWPIMTEPFTQWVIEDHFPDGRPPFEKAGAQMVEDVEPFERMKLRMLNGSHSTMAYLGYLAGYEYISDVMGDADFVKLIHGLMTEEAMPTLDMPGVDLGAYRDQLLDRFRNPALKHRTWQIAMDGIAEAAAAPARHHPRAAQGGPAVRPARASGSRRGCATSPASTRRARPSTCAIRWPCA